MFRCTSSYIPRDAKIPMSERQERRITTETPRERGIAANQKDEIQRETGRVGAARCGDRLRGRFLYSPLFPRPSRGLVCPTRLHASLVAPTWRDSERSSLAEPSRASW